MTRQEALKITDELTPEGFRFNALELTDGEWKASFINDSTPPQVVIERWDDYYTEADPEPETDASDETVSERVTQGGTGNG